MACLTQLSQQQLFSSRTTLPQRRRLAVAVRAASAANGRDVTGLSSLRFAKPSLDEISGLAKSWTSRTFNHSDTGASISAPALPEEVKNGGYMITTNRKKVGEGKRTYDDAVKAIKEWEQLQLGAGRDSHGARAADSAPGRAPVRPHTPRALSLCAPPNPPAFVPAEPVVYSKEEAADFGPGNKGRRFAVGLASLNGHQLAGEERFSVELHADGSVWYDVFLFSKPDTLLAWASLPIVKLQQWRYVNDSLKALASALA
eukprot:scaffold5.g809.t1